MKIERAYSVLEIKAVSEDERVIEGIATTPTTDRMGDVVEPKGAEFKLPVPLLWQHDSGQPIGHVISAKVTADGITVKARLATIAEPGALKDRLDMAWQSIKSGLVRGLSIGFRSIESARIDNTFAYRFLKWELLELSAVTVPANQEATITAIKSIDQEIRNAQRAPSGTPVVRLPEPSAARAAAVTKTAAKGNTMKTVAEQIASYDEVRKAKQAERQAIMSGAAEKGETLNAEQTEAYDGLTAEIKSIDAHLTRLKDMETEQAVTAKTVGKVETVGSGVEFRSGIVVKAPPKLPPGIAFARIAKCVALSKGNPYYALQVAETVYKDDPRIIDVMKAAVSAGTTTSWSSFLVGDEGSAFADFVEFLRPMTIVGKFGTGGIPSLRRVPFRVALLSQATGASGFWVGESKGIGLTKVTGARTHLEPLKVASICALSNEVVRDSSPSAEAFIRDELAKALTARLDTDFADPAVDATAGIRPQSVTYGAATVASTGTDSDAVRLDVRALMQKFIDADNPPTTGVWIMSSSNALALSMMLNGLGQPEFPGITMAGGTFFGLPVITSEYVGTAVALVNASDIWFADDGGIEVDMSSEASLEMLDTGLSSFSGSTPTYGSQVSMFQTDSVALRAKRSINWARRRTQSVAYLTSVVWGGAVPAS